MVPLYLPMVLDEEMPAKTPVFLGGVNLYLQQKIRMFRRAPRWVDRLLDSERILRAAAERAAMTRAEDLGEMTLSSFEGAEGKQAKEWRKLLAWIREVGCPDVVSLSNGLLIGIAKSVRREIGVPVVATLQGEDVFMEGLPEPYRTQCWDAFRKESEHVSRFVAVSRFYGGRMKERLGAEGGKLRVVHNGVDPAAFAPAGEPPDAPVIGYLARMCHGKGLHVLVRAFLMLKKKGSPSGLRLRIGGAKTSADENYVDGLRQEIEAAGCPDAVDWLPNLDGAAKREFLQSLSLLSVPAIYDEAFGLYLIEAMASGVPVVQPNRGAFPEIIEESGGGVLLRGEGGEEESLAAGLEEVLLDEGKRLELGRRGREAVESKFNAAAMARNFTNVLEEAVAEPNLLERR